MSEVPHNFPECIIDNRSTTD